MSCFDGLEWKDMNNERTIEYQLALLRTQLALEDNFRAVARACGLLLVLPADYFRAFHLRHHRFTQDPARDPELAPPPLTRRCW